jgi:hypothetical protein
MAIWKDNRNILSKEEEGKETISETSNTLGKESEKHICDEKDDLYDNELIESSECQSENIEEKELSSYDSFYSILPSSSYNSSYSMVRFY